MIHFVYWLLPGLGGLALLASAVNFLMVFEARRFARRRRDQTPPEFPPEHKAVVIVPCRGAVPGFRRHCQALLDQDYPNFEVLFVVENEQDSAVRIIRSLMQEHRLTRISLLFSGPAEHCSQKVHQLRTAVQQLPGNARVVAFLDSDLLVRRQWLRWLCGKLSEPGIGASTGAVWSVPRRESFFSNVQCSVSNWWASTFGPRCAPALWGSWAVRVDRLESSGLKSAWATSFSEKWVARRALCLNGERLAFEPLSVGVREVETNRSQLRRALLRWWRGFQVCHPWTGRGLFLAALAVQAGFWGLLFGWAHSVSSSEQIRWTWLALAGGVFALNSAGGIVRGQLGKQYAEDSRFNRLARRWDCWAWPVNAAVMLLSDMGARCQTRIRWNDLVYLVDSTGRVNLLGKKRQPPAPTESATGQIGQTLGLVLRPEEAPPQGVAPPPPLLRNRAG